MPDTAGLAENLLAGIARRHQVSGLVAFRLVQAGRPVPRQVQRRALLARQTALAQLGAALDLAQALAAAGIRAVFLKGVALSQQAFGSPLLRYAADLDILVALADVPQAWQVLDAAGYARQSPRGELAGARLGLFCRASKDSIHRHPESGLVVELHWRMGDDPADAGLPPAGQLTMVELAPGQALPVLVAEAQFAYLCQHGAAHGWARLKWLTDVAALLHRAPDGGSALWRQARSGRAAIAAASAIMLAQRLLGAPPPPGFVAPRALRLRLLNALALRVIQAGGGARELEATPWRGWAEIAAKLLVAPGWRTRLAALRRLALAGEDIAAIALPRGLFWLYPVLRLPLLVRRRAARGARLRRRGGEDNTLP